MFNKPRTATPIREQLRIIWMDASKRQLNKVEVEVQLDRSMQKLRWAIEDVLKEYDRDKKSGLTMARDLFFRDD